MTGMEKVTQKYRSALLTELKPHPDNPRQGDVGAIHTSIERNGFYGALVVQKSTGFVLAGNHRLIAAQQAGADRLPVIEIDCDDATATRILLADNRTNDLATYDQQALSELLTILASADDLLGTGYDGDDLDDLLASLQEQGLQLPDGNVQRDGGIAGRLERYNASSTRSVILDYPLERFRWIVDQLGALREQFGAESNADVVQQLIENAVEEKGPADG